MGSQSVRIRLASSVHAVRAHTGPTRLRHDSADFPCASTRPISCAANPYDWGYISRGLPCQFSTLRKGNASRCFPAYRRLRDEGMAFDNFRAVLWIESSREMTFMKYIERYGAFLRVGVSQAEDAHVSTSAR